MKPPGRQIASPLQARWVNRFFQQDSTITTTVERQKLIQDARQPTSCFDRLAFVPDNLKVATSDRLQNQLTSAKCSPCVTREELYPVLFAGAAGCPSNLYNVTWDTGRQLCQHATHDTGRQRPSKADQRPSKADSAQPASGPRGSVKSTTTQDTVRQLRQHATHDTGRQRLSNADRAQSVPGPRSSVKSTTHGSSRLSSSVLTHGSGGRHIERVIVEKKMHHNFQPSKRMTASQNKSEVDCGGARRRGSSLP